MQRLSESQRSWLREAADRYHLSLPGSPAEEHLASRDLAFKSIVHEETARFRLGYVADALRGHEMYRGCLAIPYLRWSQELGWSVVSIRFRRIDGGALGSGAADALGTSAPRSSGPKYMTVAGDRPRLYNTLALLRQSPTVAVCEGELDAITAEACGIPAVGVPGAHGWKTHFREPFLGYREVFVLADGDDAGMTFANTVAETLPNAKIIPMPSGSDVNSLFVEQGKQAVLERIKP